MELKISQKLSSVDQHPLFLVFLDNLIIVIGITSAHICQYKGSNTSVNRGDMKLKPEYSSR